MKKLVVLVVLVMAIFMIAIGSLFGQVEWSTPEIITTFYHSFIPAISPIVIDQDGNWNIVHNEKIFEDDHYERRYVKYVNEISGTQTIAEAYGSAFYGEGDGVGAPSITISPDGTLHITYSHWTWEGEWIQNLMYTFKEQGSEPWSTPEIITTFYHSFIPAISPIVIDQDGNWNIVHNEKIFEDDHYERRYVKYVNEISGTQTIAEAYGSAFYGEGDGVGAPSITISPDGTLHITYSHWTWEEEWIQNLMYTFKEPETDVNPEIKIIRDQLRLTNYPNPFNSKTTISFSLIEEGNVELTIYSLKGQKVQTLFDDQLDSGFHEVVWNGKDQNNNKIPSGVYLCKLKSERHELTQKMILLR